MFPASLNQTLSYFPPQKENGKVVVMPPHEVFAEGEILWKNSVVAQFIGKVPNFSLFQKLINMLWGNEREVVIRSAGPNLFIIQFPNVVARDRVLESDP